MPSKKFGETPNGSYVITSYICTNDYMLGV